MKQRSLLAILIAIVLMGATGCSLFSKNTENIAKGLLEEKYGNNKIKSVTVEIESADHLRGLVTFQPLPEDSENGREGEGGIFLAAKVKGEWKLVFDGNGGISCKELTPYSFPSNMISDCYVEEVSNKPWTTVMLVKDFKNIRNYLKEKDNNAERKMFKIAGFVVENFGPTPPYDQISIKGEKNGEYFSLLFGMENTNLVNVSLFRKNKATGEYDNMVYADLMYEQEIITAKEIVLIIIDEINAEEAFNNFFTYLANKEYAKAVPLLAVSDDDWNEMANYTEEKDKGDKIKVLENYCEAVQTCLKSKVLQAEKEEAGYFKLTVQFLEADGKVFVLPPCCGATEKEMPSQTDFPFGVRKLDDDWKVARVPLYRP